MNNVTRFKRKIVHWLSNVHTDVAACGRKGPKEYTTLTEKVTCKTCRDIAEVSGARRPVNKPLKVRVLDESHIITTSQTDKLITAGLRAAETEINGAVAQAQRALDTALLPREPGLIIRDLRVALERMLKLVKLLG